MASKSHKRGGDKPAKRHISVRAVRRDPPDLKKLSEALIALAMAQAEAEAQADHEKVKKSHRGAA